MLKHREKPNIQFERENMVLENQVSPRRVDRGGLGRGNMQKDNGREFFRPDNKAFLRFSPNRDKLNRNMYPKIS